MLAIIASDRPRDQALLASNRAKSLILCDGLGL